MSDYRDPLAHIKGGDFEAGRAHSLAKWNTIVDLLAPGTCTNYYEVCAKLRTEMDCGPGSTCGLCAASRHCDWCPIGGEKHIYGSCNVAFADFEVLVARLYGDKRTTWNSIRPRMLLKAIELRDTIAAVDPNAAGIWYDNVVACSGLNA